MSRVLRLTEESRLADENARLADELDRKIILLDEIQKKSRELEHIAHQLEIDLSLASRSAAALHNQRDRDLAEIQRLRIENQMLKTGGAHV